MPTRPTAAELEPLRGGLRIIALRALRDADLADEAVQETLSRAVIALEAGRVDDPAKLGAYVAGIANHVCLHMLRDRKDTVSLEDDSGEPRGFPQLRTVHNPLEALISEDERKRLRAAFDELSQSDQRLLRLSFHEDRSPTEIAAALSEPPERVRKRKSRALERLRQAFLGVAASDAVRHQPGHDDAARGTSRVAPPTPTGHERTSHD